MVNGLSLPKLQVLADSHLPKVIPRLLEMRAIRDRFVERDQEDLAHSLPFFIAYCSCADLADAQHHIRVACSDLCRQGRAGVMANDVKTLLGDSKAVQRCHKDSSKPRSTSQGDILHLLRCRIE